MRNILRRAVAGAVVGLAIVASATTLRAIEEQPIPEFTVSRADGTAVASTQLNRSAQYVIIYATPNCRPCNRLIDLLKQWNAPALTARVTVIYGGPADAAATYVAERVPVSAGRVTAYGDPDREGFKALKLGGSPVILGIRDGRILWSVSGVLNDATAVESIVKTWIAQ